MLKRVSIRMPEKGHTKIDFGLDDKLEYHPEIVDVDKKPELGQPNQNKRIGKLNEWYENLAQLYDWIGEKTGWF
jgi:hypothetical protein